ncbi:SAM-dependent methyltransferase, partial [Rhizobium phaseoli]
MSGALFVIGTGPGNPEQMTPEALAAVEAATDFFGYGPYLDRLQLRHDQLRHVSDNREE